MKIYIRRGEAYDGQKPSGGGGVTYYFSWNGDVPIFRGTFFKPLRNYGYLLHNF